MKSKISYCIFFIGVSFLAFINSGCQSGSDKGSKKEQVKIKLPPQGKRPAMMMGQKSHITISGTAASAVIQFGMPGGPNIPCESAASICGTQSSVSITQLGSGQIPTAVTEFYMDQSGNFDLLIHTDSFLNKSGCCFDPAIYDTLHSLLWNGSSSFNWRSGSLISPDICTSLGITTASSGLFNPTNGLLIPFNTLCILSQPFPESDGGQPIDTDVIQISFSCILDSTAMGSSATILLGGSACDNNSSGICSFQPLNSSGNPVLISLTNSNSIWFMMNYNNLVAAQPNMAQYFTLDAGGNLTGGTLHQADPFVFTSDLSFIKTVPTGLTIPAQDVNITVWNNNWFGVQYLNTTIQTPEQIKEYVTKHKAQKKATVPKKK